MIPGVPIFPRDERPEWRRWVTPGLLREKPVHRWLVLAHSFTSELVQALAEDWGLGAGATVLDPFVGAGTTILAAQQRGISAVGFDLSPLAVFASRVKTEARGMDPVRMGSMWAGLRPRCTGLTPPISTRSYAPLVARALTGPGLAMFEAIAREVDGLAGSQAERDFFRLAILAALPQHSTAIPSGGWLKWGVAARPVEQVSLTFVERVEMMLLDLSVPGLAGGTSDEGSWEVALADARRLPLADASVDAVISSPPYPNRHDYTRVYGVELLFGFLDWEGARSLRRQSLHSHPEASPDRPEASAYRAPAALVASVSRLRGLRCDPRVARMLEGYFLDLYICLREIARVCIPGGRVALILGNAQYLGEIIPVDELSAEIGEQVGLRCQGLVVARTRGNSAQQMKAFGLRPSRETVVLFRKP